MDARSTTGNAVEITYFNFDRDTYLEHATDVEQVKEWMGVAECGALQYETSKGPKPLLNLYKKQATPPVKSEASLVGLRQAVANRRGFHK